jgi:DNA-binding PadR family transcriptional regulator
MTALLEDRMSGYELTKSFDTSLGFFWKASHQQIYKELRALEKLGHLRGELIPQAGKPDKVVYELTEEGRRALDSWVLGQSRHSDSKDDLLVKLYNLSEDNAAHLYEEFRARAEQTHDTLALYRRIRERHYAHPEQLPLRRRGIYVALLGGIRHCEMRLDWIDEALEMIAPARKRDRA